MEYIKINFKIEPDNELNREILIAELESEGFESFAETDKSVEAYMPTDLYSQTSVNYHQYFNDKPFSLDYSVEKIPDKDWNEVWEKNYFEPLLINDQCLIRAPFHTEYPRAKYEIIIEPKMAFGTGYHETTYLMISEILQIDLRGKSVLDMGCGTGILGIMASLKGAASITCIDIDEWSYRNTLENSSYNHISNINVKLGGAELLKDHKFDLILANIHRNVLLHDMSTYRDSLNNNGQLLISGFYQNDLPALNQKANSLGLELTGLTEKNQWIALKFSLK